MIIQPGQRRFDLADGHSLEITFFHSDRFRHVLRDHFLSESEPWDRVFRWNRKKLIKLSQKLNSSAELVEEETYPQAVEVLGTGIQYAINLPVYAKFIQERRPVNSSPYHSDGYYFVGKAGFLVITREDIVRTAFFVARIQKNASHDEFVKEAKKYVIRRKVKAEAYLDGKGQVYVKHVECSLVSAENWR